MNPILIEKFKHIKKRDINSSLTRPPWMQYFYYDTQDPYENLNAELIDFGKWIFPTKAEQVARSTVINLISAAVSELKPTFVILPFGSAATNSNLPCGDIDLVLIIPDDYEIKHSMVPQTILEVIGIQLKQKGILSKYKFINASTPILKAVDAIYNFSIDISLNQYNGILNIERVENVFSTYPSFYPVFMVLKLLLDQHGLNVNYEGGIASNLLFNMIFSVLQASDTKLRLNPALLLYTFLYTYGQLFNPMETIIDTTSGGRYRMSQSLAPVFRYISPQDNFTVSTSGYHHYDFIKLCNEWDLMLREHCNEFNNSKLNYIFENKFISDLQEKRIKLHELMFGNTIMLNETREETRKEIVTKRFDVIASFISASADAARAKHPQMDENELRQNLKNRAFELNQKSGSDNMKSLPNDAEIVQDDSPDKQKENEDNYNRMQWTNFLNFIDSENSRYAQMKEYINRD